MAPHIFFVRRQHKESSRKPCHFSAKVKFLLRREMAEMQVLALPNAQFSEHALHKLDDVRIAMLLDKNTTKRHPFCAASGIDWAHAIYARVTRFVDICYVLIRNRRHKR